MPIDTAKRDARNALTSLALRAERDHPALAVALLDALRPTLEFGVLEIRYGPTKLASFRMLKKHERDLQRYTDHTLSIVTTE